MKKEVYYLNMDLDFVSENSRYIQYIVHLESSSEYYKLDDLDSLYFKLNIISINGWRSGGEFIYNDNGYLDCEHYDFIRMQKSPGKNPHFNFSNNHDNGDLVIACVNIFQKIEKMLNREYSLKYKMVEKEEIIQQRKKI